MSIKKLFCLLLASMCCLQIVSAAAYAVPRADEYAILEVAAVKNSSVAVRVKAPGRCTAVAAVYSLDGRMLGAGQVELVGEAGEREIALPVSINQEWPDYYTVRTFLLDSESAPLCEACTYNRTAPPDYARAFQKGYVDPAYAERRGGDQITSSEFKAMLARAVSALD